MQQTRGAPEPELPPGLLDELRAKLDAGLTPEQRQEIARLLVSVVETTNGDDGKATAKLLIRTRFPACTSDLHGHGFIAATNPWGDIAATRQECAAFAPW